MTNKEKIIAEIERRYRENKDKLTKLPMHCDEASRLRRMCSEDLYFRDFINSLHAEPSEDLEKEVDRVVKEVVTPEVLQDYIAGFKAGAQWQKEQLINNACNWLNQHVVEYHPRTGELKPVVNINAFREAMEKEDE